MEKIIAAQAKHKFGDIISFARYNQEYFEVNITTVPAFHLAFPVNNLESTYKFYVDLIGCRVGRQTNTWMDFNFFGHQITAHLSEDANRGAESNMVDGDMVPVRHFGVILDWEGWHELVRKLRRADVQFIVEPHTRFNGEIGEQATFFCQDPSGNALEFKSFKDMSQVFAT